METLMDEVCAYINNWFPAKPVGKHRGTWIVEGGNISADFLQENQYFRIVGSVFNDGVWKYPAADMTDEVFSGEIWAMKVPPAFMALLSEIEGWNAKYGGADSVNMSPYSAESFNNYSYSKSGASRRNSGGSGSPTLWQDVYGARLIRWRKI